jgi:DHA2 family multidrug resistance protein
MRHPGAPHEVALRELWRMVYAQAQTLAFADSFRVIMVAFMIATCLVPLMRKVAPIAK